MAKLSAENFIDYVERSGLVEEDQLQKSLDALKAKHGGLSRKTRSSSPITLSTPI